MIQAVGFDLGETRIRCAGLPPNWQGLYRQVLARVAEPCQVDVAEEDMAQYGQRKTVAPLQELSDTLAASDRPR